MYVLETKQVSKIDHYLIEKGYYTILELIHMAGSAFFQHVCMYHHPLILAGFGNNGADALQVAQLFQKNGVEADVWIYKKELLNENCQILSKNLKIINKLVFSEQYDVVIDGVFGAGLNRAIEDDLAKIFDLINNLPIPRYSIDIPSGINGDGIVFDHYFHCNEVITFMGLKKLYLIPELKAYYHKVCLESLGIDENVFIENRIASLIDKKYALNHLKERKYDDYKNKNGVILHLTGSGSYTGASMMAVRGSLYSGCGIVKVCSTPEVIRAIQTTSPEAVCYIRQNPIDIREDAVLLGSGLGVKEDSIELVQEVLKKCKVPLVIDADGINILAKHKEWLKNAECPVVLTPHLGEYRRIDPEGDIDAFVKEYHCTVILKGPNTKIADPDRVYMNSTGNKGMATGGSGDTLAGILVSLLGQGYKMNEACCLAVYLHGKAGDQLAKKYYNVMPTQLAEQVGIEMRKLERKREG